MQITCNYAPRAILHWHELTAREQAEFDWIEDPADSCYSFFRYRGEIYCLADFMRPPIDLAEKRWHGIHTDSYFSAILIRLVDLGESVIVARVYT
jgi:hypothetical protein